MTSLNLFDPAIASNPYPTYELIRAAGPVAVHDEMPMAMVSGFKEATAVLDDPVTFSSAAGRVGPDLFGAPVMLFADPPDHGRLRGPVTKAFTPRGIASLAPMIDDLATELVGTIVTGAVWDAVEGLSTPLPVIVIAEMLGVPSSDRAQFKAWSDDLISVNTAFEPEASKQAWDGALALRGYMADIIEARRADPRDDLVSRLVLANIDGDIDESELLAACVLLLVAGNETTTNLISNAVLALGRRPDLVRSLQADPSQVAPFIEEILRWDPPVQATARFTTATTTIGDCRLESGQMVMVLLAAADRDPRRFEAPSELRLGRADGGHVAFGHGIHYCVGAALARLEARAAIAALLRCDTHEWRVSDEDAIRYGPSFFLRGLTRLPMCFT